MVGFFSRISKKIEQINRGKADPDTLSDEMYIEDPAVDAKNEWREMSQRLLVNAENAVNQSAERVFMIVDFTSAESQLKLQYQIDCKLIDWQDLPDEEMQRQVQKQLVAQTPEVVAYINEQYKLAEAEPLTFVELQLEMATFAWFSHQVNDVTLTIDELASGWKKLLEQCHEEYALDSDQALPWFPKI